MNSGKIILIIFTLSILTGMCSVLSYSEELSGLGVMSRVDNRDNGVKKDDDQWLYLSTCFSNVC